MSGHTQGLLRVLGEACIIDEKDNILVNIFEDKTTPDDARRIAACWNAFDGIPTEKFEGKSVEEFVTKEAYLTGMQPSPHKGGFNIGITGLATQMLAESFAGQFKGSGAINFLEFNMAHPEIGDFTVTMQKADGLTPGQMRKKAEAELATARALLAELMDTELADMACAGSHAPVEDILGRISAFLNGGQS